MNFGWYVLEAVVIVSVIVSSAILSAALIIDVVERRKARRQIERLVSSVPTGIKVSVPEPTIVVTSRPALYDWENE